MLVQAAVRPMGIQAQQLQSICLVSGSLHGDSLRENIYDAPLYLCRASSHNRMAVVLVVQSQYADLSMVSPISGGRFQNIDAHVFQRALLAHL